MIYQNLDFCVGCEISPENKTMQSENKSACIINFIYTNKNMMRREQAYFFDLMDKFNICDYCNYYDPELLIVKTHQNTYICCECAKKCTKEFWEKLKLCTINTAVKIQKNVKPLDNKPLIFQQMYGQFKEYNTNLFDLLNEEVEKYKAKEPNHIFNSYYEVVRNKIRLGKMRGSTSYLTGDSYNYCDDVVVNKRIDWDYISDVYFISDYNHLTTMLKGVEDKVNIPLNYSSSASLKVNYKPYFDRFNEFEIIRLKLENRKVLMAVLANSKKNMMYRILDVADSTGHMVMLTDIENSYISNLICKLKNSKDKTVDYFKLLENAYLTVQKTARSYIDSIKSKLVDDVKYYEELKRDNSKIKKMTVYLKVCDIIKSYGKLGSHYCNIDRDLEYFTNYIHCRLEFALSTKLSQMRLCKKLNRQQALNDTSYSNIRNETVNDETRMPRSIFKQINRDELIIETDCSVCFLSDTNYYNPIIYCSECETGTHIKCIGLTEIPPKDYYCSNCFNNAFNYCIICGLKGYFLQPSKNGKVYYHTFCIFAAKMWYLMTKDTNYTDDFSNSKTAVCYYCRSNYGILNSCSKCRTCIYHYFCAYLNGCRFGITNYNKLSYEAFMKDKYEYHTKVHCQTCSVNHLTKKKNIAKNEADLLFLKIKYLRQASINPEFTKTYLEFEDYFEYMYK